MEDSLLLQKILELKILQDSTSIRINHLSELITGIKSESWFYKSLPLIGVLVGGLITWFIQNSLKKKELSLANFRELKDTSKGILTSLIGLQFQLKELAYLEVDTNLEDYIYKTCGELEKKRAYEELYNNYKYKAEIKSKVSSCVAEINSGFIAYYKLLKQAVPESMNTMLNNFTEHILKLPKDPPWDNKINDTTEYFSLREQGLATEYTKNIKELVDLTKSLKISTTPNSQNAG
jgi:hypothetical protein